MLKVITIAVIIAAMVLLWAFFAKLALIGLGLIALIMVGRLVLAWANS